MLKRKRILVGGGSGQVYSKSTASLADDAESHSDSTLGSDAMDSAQGSDMESTQGSHSDSAQGSDSDNFKDSDAMDSTQGSDMESTQGSESDAEQDSELSDAMQDSSQEDDESTRVSNTPNRFNEFSKIDMVSHFGDYASFTDEIKLVDSKSFTQSKVPGEVNQIRYSFNREINNYSDYFKFSEQSDYETFGRHIVDHCLSSRKLKAWGFTKPLALIVCPFRNDAYQYITEMAKILGCEISKTERLIDEYFATSDFKNKSSDYKELFKGNIDDNFKIGVKIRKNLISPFSGFYGSDLIIASPLALHRILGEDGGGESDFLSSIQISIFHNSHVFMMQNILHLETIFKNLNLIPKTDRGADISKISSWYLDGAMGYKRQTVVISDFWTPELVVLQKYCKNVNGRVKESRFVQGGINNVKVSVPMIFQRINDCSASDVIDARFKYFTEKVLPKAMLGESGYTMVVIPSYFDLLRVQKYCKDNNYNYNTISEYTSRSKIDRSRHYFQQGEVKLLLFSERHYFFKRTVIKQVKHLLFYGPLTFPYFSDFVNMVEDEKDATCLMLYSKYDQMGLERVVGSERVQRMIKGQKETFMIVA